MAHCYVSPLGALHGHGTATSAASASAASASAQRGTSALPRDDDASGAGNQCRAGDVGTAEQRDCNPWLHCTPGVPSSDEKLVSDSGGWGEQICIFNKER